MPLPVASIGATTEPVVHQVDARWLMAYAASVGALGPAFLDTTTEPGIVGHPLFPVAIEWPAVLAARDLLLQAGLTKPEVRRGVHLTHRLEAERPVLPGDVLSTTATIASMTEHRSGALVTLDLRTVDPDGTTVCRTLMGTLYREVLLDHPAGDIVPRADLRPHPSRSSRAADHQTTIDIAAGAAHTYTECSRIWNPIHTDAGAAARAGLPAIVLHGTATLASAVSAVAAGAFGSDGEAVRSIEARFGALVTMPSTLTVRTWSTPGSGPSSAGPLAFEVLGGAGEPVIRDGWIAADPAPID